jgi:hypothetical protein
MATKKSNLQNALQQQAKGQVIDAPITQTESSKVYKQPSRVGKTNITGYFVPAVKSSFRMIQTKHPEKTIQDLLGEALNDLFAKYNVPQTAQLDE